MRFSVAHLLIGTVVIALCSAIIADWDFAFHLIQASGWMTLAGQAVEVIGGCRRWTLVLLSMLNAVCVFCLGMAIVGFSTYAMVAGCVVGFLIGRRNLVLQSRQLINEQASV